MQARFTQHFARQIDASHGCVFIDVAQDIGQLKRTPEVMREIERTIRQASPFPAPVRMGRVVYNDTWLWHSSGKFQLDTLTEGQD